MFCGQVIHKADSHWRPGLSFDGDTWRAAVVAPDCGHGQSTVHASLELGEGDAGGSARVGTDDGRDGKWIDEFCESSGIDGQGEASGGGSGAVVGGEPWRCGSSAGEVFQQGTAIQRGRRGVQHWGNLWAGDIDEMRGHAGCGVQAAIPANEGQETKVAGQRKQECSIGGAGNFQMSCADTAINPVVQVAGKCCVGTTGFGSPRWMGV